MITLWSWNQACGTAFRAFFLRRLGWTTSLRTPPGEASTPSRSWIARCQDSACVALRTELPHGPQGDVLDADRARADQLQGVDVDSRQGGRRVVGAVGRGRRAHGGDAGLHQLGGAALGLVLDRGGAGPELEGPLGARMRSTRAHSAGPSPRGRGTWRPRLRRVRWRTLEPQRTRRWVKWGSGGRTGSDGSRPWGGSQEIFLLGHCIWGFRRPAIENQRLAAQNTPNSAKIAPRLANLGQAWPNSCSRTIPLPSSMKIRRSPSTRRCVSPLPVGQRTVTASACVRSPRPKCRRKSFTE